MFLCYVNKETKWQLLAAACNMTRNIITFCAEDDILAIQMLRQECGVSSEKIRRRANVRDVVNIKVVINVQITM